MGLEEFSAGFDARDMELSKLTENCDEDKEESSAESHFLSGFSTIEVVLQDIDGMRTEEVAESA